MPLFWQQATNQMMKIYHMNISKKPAELDDACPFSVEGKSGHILLLGLKPACQPIKISLAKILLLLYYNAYFCYARSLIEWKLPACILWFSSTLKSEPKYNMECKCCLNRNASSNTFFVETLRRKHVALKVLYTFIGKLVSKQYYIRFENKHIIFVQFN